MDWYYIVDGQQSGPVGNEEFKALVQSKKIGAATRVRRRDSETWHTLEELIQRRRKPAPPSQPAASTDDPSASVPRTETTATPPPLEMAASEPPLEMAAPEPPLEMAAPVLPVEIDTEIPPARGTCSECGQSFLPDDLIAFENAQICAACKPLFLQKIREGVPLAGSMDFGGFWIRFVAKFVDGIILGVVNLVVMFAILIPITFSMAKSESGLMAATIAQMAIQLLALAFTAAYNTFFVGRFSATPGKMLCRLKVVTAEGQRVSYLRALGRNFAELISYFILLIGYIMAAFDDEKRALHDRICETRVVRV